MSSPITQAVISAGGRGLRLAPFTLTSPKPMVPLLGKPLLEWHIEQYKKHGVNEFFFMLGYLPEVIKNHFGDGSRFGVNIHYHIESQPLGSFGSMADITGLGQTFYFIYGDVFSLVDYTPMANVYLKKEHPIGMQRVGHTQTNDADLVELDSRGRFTMLHKKPHKKIYPDTYSLRGVSILDKEISQYIERGVPNDFAKDVLPRAIADHKNFYGYECEEYSKGIDTIEKVKEVEAYLFARQLKK